MSLSRSRPYHKNDNRFVEQKNSSLVRAYVGYERLDKVAQCAALNALYDKLWLYYNLFQPVMHLVGKQVINRKLRRKHDLAKTPYHRLLTSGSLSPENKTRLAQLYAQTNPRSLRAEIYEGLEKLWKNQNPPELNNRKEAAFSGNISN